MESFTTHADSIRQRIDEGIETNRKGLRQIRFLDAFGNPANDVHYRLKLIRHHFLFGCNAFMLDGYKESAQNKAYEKAFTDVFNAAVVPFFWSDLEPEQGHLRFRAHSTKIHRRPPPDAVLEFCRRHRITPKGHCLLWHQHLPAWLPSNLEKTLQLIQKRIGQIAAEFGDEILYWDVINEPMEKYLSMHKHRLPEDYVFKSLEYAAALFPKKTLLTVNEATVFSWKEFHDETTGLYLLIQNLLLRGIRIDRLGFQYHYFFYDRNGLVPGVEALAEQGRHLLDPIHLFKVLDGYKSLQIPIHISEITIPTYPGWKDGEMLQASLLRELYRLWFSHPNVEGIYWWNLADGAAYGREGELKAGLLREDLSPKPSYEVLKELLHKEWGSSQEGLAQGQINFKGFYGTYELETHYRGECRRCELELTKQDACPLTIQVAEPQGAMVFTACI